MRAAATSRIRPACTASSARTRMRPKSGAPVCGSGAAFVSVGSAVVCVTVEDWVAVDDCVAVEVDDAAVTVATLVKAQVAPAVSLPYRTKVC